MPFREVRSLFAGRAAEDSLVNGDEVLAFDFGSDAFAAEFFARAGHGSPAAEWVEDNVSSFAELEQQFLIDFDLLAVRMKRVIHPFRHDEIFPWSAEPPLALGLPVEFDVDQDRAAARQDAARWVALCGPVEMNMPLPTPLERVLADLLKDFGQKLLSRHGDHFPARL